MGTYFEVGEFFTSGVRYGYVFKKNTALIFVHGETLEKPWQPIIAEIPKNAIPIRKEVVSEEIQERVEEYKEGDKLKPLHRSITKRVFTEMCLSA
jgi:hypothetical protein